MSQEFRQPARDKRDILIRLDAVKPSHGSWRKCQDALHEIVKARAERDAALARVAELEAQLNQSRAA